MFSNGGSSLGTVRLPENSYMVYKCIKNEFLTHHIAFNYLILCILSLFLSLSLSLSLSSHLSCPLAMMAMVSPSISASSIECVVMIITLFCFILSIRFQTSLLIFGSIPVVGSSRNITRGSPRKLRATLSRRFMPPLNVLTRWLATCKWCGVV